MTSTPWGASSERVAGLTERSFYESFRSLDEALVALMEDVAAEIEERSRAAAEEARELYDLDRDVAEGEMAGLLFIGGMAELVTAWLDGSLDASPEQLVDAATAAFIAMHR